MTPPAVSYRIYVLYFSGGAPGPRYFVLSNLSFFISRAKAPALRFAWTILATKARFHEPKNIHSVRCNRWHWRSMSSSTSRQAKISMVQKDIVIRVINLISGFILGMIVDKRHAGGCFGKESGFCWVASGKIFANDHSYQSRRTTIEASQELATIHQTSTARISTTQYVCATPNK